MHKVTVLSKLMDIMNRYQNILIQQGVHPRFYGCLLIGSVLLSSTPK